MDRREFLKKMSAGSIAAMSASIPGSFMLNGCGKEVTQIDSSADTVILLWMAGGMAHTETFDPKEYTPYEKGLESNRVLSTFPKSPTAVDGLYFSEGLEEIGSVMDKGAVIRSYRAADMGHILHTRHQYHWHTCYEPPQTVQMPHIGAWIAHELGPKNPVIPPFISIGQRFNVGEGEELKAYHTAGFLGQEYGPFLIPDPSSGLSMVQPPVGMDVDRFEKRHRLYRDLVEKSKLGKIGSDYQKESMVRAMEKSYKLLKSPEAEAFNLENEPNESYEKYNTGRFGLGCLLAKRLTEAGARFISVSTEYVPFKGWDTHENGHDRTVEMKKSINRPIGQLIRDLDKTGRLDDTLVILASEFSRDMMVEGRPGKEVKEQAKQPEVMKKKSQYGLHKHFTDGCSILMFGGGIDKGTVYGKTADERPCKTVEDQVRIDDIHQTIYHALGIPPETHYEVEGRPVYTTPEGHGEPIPELLANMDSKADTGESSHG